jgi:predicted SPOUT superfamily RNA methylase MTH1
MQIVQLNEKDILDAIVIFREHDVGDSDAETINSLHISELLADDWGFYYTVTTNLSKVKAALPKYDPVQAEDRADIEAKIDKLASAIEERPKSTKWKIRARVGPSAKWYRDVDEFLR